MNDAAAPGLWYSWGQEHGGRRTLTAWLSGHFPDAAVVSDADAEDAGAPPEVVLYVAWVDTASDEVVDLAVGPSGSAPTTAWFARVRGRAGRDVRRLRHR